MIDNCGHYSTRFSWFNLMETPQIFSVSQFQINQKISYHYDLYYRRNGVKGHINDDITNHEESQEDAVDRRG